MSRARRGAIAAAAATSALAWAACSSGARPPVSPNNPLADSADQVMFGVRTFITDQGLLRAQMRADTGYFFDGNSRIEVRNERTVFFTNTGQQSAVLTSIEGTVNTSRSTMEARKNVIVISEEGKRLETTQLAYNQTTNLISSDSAFVLTEPTRRVEGVGFVSDPNLTNFRILKLARGAGPIPLSGEKP
jgi:LPS export ABC transporter protein LptC